MCVEHMLDHYQKLHGSQTRATVGAEASQLDHYQKLHGSQTIAEYSIVLYMLDHYQKLHGSQTKICFDSSK